MRPDDQSVAAIFDAALVCATPAERASYLGKACGDDTLLRARVEKLLAAHDQASQFLEPAPSPNPTIRLELPGDEKPGDVIGHYKIREKIGEGGCGVVYVADQEQPVRRRVALKVVKLGMDTKQVVARFEAERQALALMDHPNIAKVLDAGATGTGRPFFVMELVRGIKITDYCDQNNLSTEERLKLFIQVCHAVQHAHQKGIIHRDLKPSNVLVTLHDGVPVPKVIDFGIAKATSDQRLTDKTIYTAFEQFLGTPAYMSPEQAEMSGLDIDTRSDIYSLGVLLYELLTGKTPFDPKTLMQAGIDQMRRIIREQEPPRPSTRLSTLTHADLTTLAKQRHAEAPKLINLISGDLDWIVMKCLEKDRTRRYETANGLAVEINRHLNNEPIIARPPSTAYRIQKLFRRNKIAVASAVCIFLVLIFGIAISSWQAVRASKAEKFADAQRIKAEREVVKSQQVASFLKEMIEAAGPSVAMGRDTTLLKDILDVMVRRVGKDLTNQPQVEAELHTIIGNTYRKIGDLDKAQLTLRRALEISESVYGEESEPVADALSDLGRVLANQGDFRTNSPHAKEAESLAQKSLLLQTKLHGTNHPKTLMAHYVLAASLVRQSRTREAEVLFRENVEKRRLVLGMFHPDLASSLNNWAICLHYLERDGEGEAALREAVTIQRESQGPDHPDVSDSLQTMGWILESQRKFQDAERAYRESLNIRRRILPVDHPKIATAWNYLIGNLTSQSKFSELRTIRAEMEKSDAAHLIPELQIKIGSLLSNRYSATNNSEEATIWFQKAADNLRMLAASGSSTDLNNLAWFLATGGNKASRNGTDAIRFAERSVAASNRKDSDSLETLAAAYAEGGRFGEAIATMKEAITLTQDETAKEEMISWLKLYESGKPYHEDGN